MKINEKDQARVRKQAKVMKTQCPEKGNEDGFQRYEKKKCPLVLKAMQIKMPLLSLFLASWNIKHKKVT